MARLYCPRCQLIGLDHDECEPAGRLAWKVSRFAEEKYLTVELKCSRCSYVFWNPSKAAIALAAAKGITP